MTVWRTMTRAEFDVWHAAYLKANGFPLRGRNALTGELAPEGVGETTRIVEPVEVVKDADVRVPEWGELALLGRPAAEPVRKLDGEVDVLETAKADAELVAQKELEAEKEREAGPVRDVLR